MRICRNKNHHPRRNQSRVKPLMMPTASAISCAACANIAARILSIFPNICASARIIFSRWKTAAPSPNHRSAAGRSSEWAIASASSRLSSPTRSPSAPRRSPARRRPSPRRRRTRRSPRGTGNASSWPAARARHRSSARPATRRPACAFRLAITTTWRTWRMCRAAPTPRRPPAPGPRPSGCSHRRSGQDPSPLPPAASCRPRSWPCRARR